MTVRQKSVATNPMKSAWQDVKQETADELRDLKAHDLALDPAASTLLLLMEANVVLTEFEQTAVGIAPDRPTSIVSASNNSSEHSTG